MKYFIAIILLFCFASSPALADDYVFREAKWGMTVEEVKAMEANLNDSVFIEEKESAGTLTSRVLVYSAEGFNSKNVVEYSFSAKNGTLKGIDSFVKSPCMEMDDITTCYDLMVDDFKAQYPGARFHRSTTNVKSNLKGTLFMEDQIVTIILD